MKCIFLILLATLCTTAPGWAQPTMTKMVIVNTTESVDPESVEALPRTIYRVGTDRARVEESPARADGLKIASIYKGSERWTLNLISKVAVHKGGLESEVVYPVYEAIPDFEYGREFEWMRKNDVKPTLLEVEGVEPLDLYTVQYGEGGPYLQMFVSKRRAIPQMVQVLSPKKTPIFEVQYKEYKAGLPVEAALFQVPSGFEIREEK